MSTSQLEEFAKRLENVVQHQGYISARCPAHSDQKNSLLVREKDGRIRINCLAGCGFQNMLSALGMEISDLQDNSPVLDCATFVEARGLPRFVLKGFILDHPRGVEIPYYDFDGTPMRSQLRTALAAKDGTSWLEGGKVGPYGLWTFRGQAPQDLYLVEGTTDAWALKACGLDAVGFPGATTAGKLMAEWGDFFRSVGTIHIVVEPDGGGVAFKGQIERWCQENSHVYVTHDMAEIGVKDSMELWQRDGNANALRGKAVRHAVYDRVIEQARRFLAGERGLMLGVDGLDEINGGFLPGEVLYLSAPPKSGKSLLASQMADNVARQGKKVVRIELEMSPDQQVWRTVHQHLGLTRDRITSERHLEQIIAMMDSENGRPVWWYDNPDLDTIVNQIRMTKPDFVLIDYLQYVVTPREKDEVKRIERVSSTLSKLAKELKFCGVYISSIDKDAGKRMVREKMKPDMFSLKGSAQLANDAFMIATLTRGDDESPMAELRVVANRGHGGQGQVIRMQYSKMTHKLEELR